MYSGRQTIEAGIKEGKNVFQMHHLKVRLRQALLLQENMACFAAEFVRFAAHWLNSDSLLDMIPAKSGKKMVQVMRAHQLGYIVRMIFGC